MSLVDVSITCEGAGQLAIATATSLYRPGQPGAFTRP
jgi:hypothetical protein